MTLSSVLIAMQLISASPSSEAPPSPEVAPPAETAEAVAPTAPPNAPGTIVVTAKPTPPPGDPLQGLNIQSFKVVQSVDGAVTGPVARGYKKALPSPVRSGLRNVLRNLSEPVVVVNYMLQLKPGKSLETLGRFAVNSTIGAAGLFDVAKSRPFALPYRANGFAYTLGYYGVKSGPYMYLPLIGPTTVRDLAGRLGDISLLPLTVGKPFNEAAFVIPTTTIRLIDERAEADDDIRRQATESPDLYATIRSRYLSRRQAEIDALRR